MVVREVPDHPEGERRRTSLQVAEPRRLHPRRYDSATMRPVVERDSVDSHAVTSVSAGRNARWHIRRVLDADPFLLAIVGIAGGLRFWALGTQSIWYDEFVTVQVASRPLGDLFGTIAKREGSPPLYFFLSWIWTRLFGDGEVALRSLSTIAGILTVAIAYSIARELGQSRRTCRLAALLVATNPLLIWYSQEARPYALFVALAAASLLWCVRAANHGRSRDFLFWGVWSALALSTHYFAVFFVAAEAAWIFLAQRHQWRRFAITCALLGAAAMAAVPFALQQRSTDQQRWIALWPLGFRLKEAGRAALLGPGARYQVLWLPAAGLLAIAPLVLGAEGRPVRTPPRGGSHGRRRSGDRAASDPFHWERSLPRQERHRVAGSAHHRRRDRARSAACGLARDNRGCGARRLVNWHRDLGGNRSGSAEAELAISRSSAQARRRQSDRGREQPRGVGSTAPPLRAGFQGAQRG